MVDVLMLVGYCDVVLLCVVCNVVDDLYVYL